MADSNSIPQNQSLSPAKIENLVFSQLGRAKKVIDGLNLMPQTLITSDISAAPVLVGTGNICRIRVTTTTYINFGTNTMTAPTSATQGALELFTAGTYLVVASNSYIMASSNPARVEIINGLF